MTSSDPEVIRRQIEETRNNLSYDVDALNEKVNPTRVVDRRVGRAKSSVSGLKDRVFGSAQETRSHVGGTTSNIAGNVQGTASNVAGNVQGAASSAAGSVQHAASSAVDTLQAAPQTLQRQAQGVVVPESFTHGSSAQRMEALQRGLKSGNPAACTYS